MLDTPSLLGKKDIHYLMQIQSFKYGKNETASEASPYCCNNTLRKEQGWLQSKLVPAYY
jgi:hypothetical protein